MILLPQFVLLHKSRRMKQVASTGALSVSKCQSLMRAAMTQLNLSARSYHRILKLARTIADLVGSEEIQSAHLAEALHASQSSEDYDGVNVGSLSFV